MTSGERHRQEVVTIRTRLIRQRSAVGVLAGCLLALSACGSGDTTAGGSPAAVGTDGDTADGHDVVMRLIAYQPERLTVPIDATVTWKQQDAGFHTVTSGTVDKAASGAVETKPDDKFASGRLAKGEEFAFLFEEAGAYEYFCEIHPATMSGRVTAE